MFCLRADRCPTCLTKELVEKHPFLDYDLWAEIGHNEVFGLLRPSVYAHGPSLSWARTYTF